jgi:tRNA (guanine-N7-)-methyltransferase
MIPSIEEKIKFKYIKSFSSNRFRKITNDENLLMQKAKDNFYIKDNEIQNIDILEIGFGCGHFTANLAKTYPNKKILASEVYKGGILQLAKMIDLEDINNIRIFEDDGRFLIPKINNDQLSYAFVLFPDPWPKRRHHIRRIVNEEFLNNLYLKITQSGNIVIATDNIEYQCAIREVIDNNKYQYKEVCDINILSEYAWFCKTKYFLKAIESGLSPVYFIINKL